MNNTSASKSTPYMDLGDSIYYNPYDGVFNYRNKDGSYSPIEMSREYTRARNRVGGYEYGPADPASADSNVPGDTKRFMRDTAENPYMEGFNKPDQKAIEAHMKKYPTKMNTGGDVSLNSDTFQVKGNPNTVDGNKYNYGGQPIALDHNEVVKGNFVFSDSLTNPLTKNKFSKDAKTLAKSLEKSEKKLAQHSDLISKKTIKHTEKLNEDLMNLHEIVATAQGKRNPDGSTKQPGQYASGGNVGGIPPGPGFIQMEDNNWYNPNTKQVLTELDGEYVELIEGSDILAPQYDAVLREQGYVPGTENTLSGKQSGKGVTTTAPKRERIIMDPEASTKDTVVISAKAPTFDTTGLGAGVASFAPQVPNIPYGDTTFNVPGQGKEGFKDFPIPLSGPPVNTIGGYMDWLMRQKPANQVTTPPVTPPTPIPTTTVPAATGTSTAGTSGSSKAAAKKTPYDITTQGPLTINNNPQGISVPISGTEYLDMQTKDVFGQVNPSVTRKNIPYSQQIANFDTLPGRLAGQNWRRVPGINPNESYMMRVGPDGKPYTATNMPPLTPEMQAMKDATTPNTAGTVSPSSVGETPAGYRVPFTAGDALQAVAVGSKFASALQPVEVEPTRANTAPITKQSYDPRSALYQNQRSYRNALNSIQAGSLNTRRAIASNLLASKLNSDSTIRQAYDERNIGENVRYQERLGQRQRENISYANYAADLNARNRAARTNNLDTAFNSLGYFGQGLNRKKQSQDAINIYSNLFPSVGDRVLSSLTNEQLAEILRNN